MGPDDAASLLGQICLMDSSAACKAFVTLALDTGDKADAEQPGWFKGSTPFQPNGCRATKVLEKMGRKL